MLLINYTSVENTLSIKYTSNFNCYTNVINSLVPNSVEMHSRTVRIEQHQRLIINLSIIIFNLFVTLTRIRSIVIMKYTLELIGKCVSKNIIDIGSVRIFWSLTTKFNKEPTNRCGSPGLVVCVTTRIRKVMGLNPGWTYFHIDLL